MVITETNKLHGKLVGYGITHSNGETVERWLENPIHNTITKHFLNNMLLANGTNATGSVEDARALWTSCSGATRTGVINFAAYGTGTGPTSTNDLDLKNRVSAYTSTKKTGTLYCGVNICNENGYAGEKVRVSYLFDAAESDTVITELGTYCFVNDTYQMSSRIVLDDPISISAGDILWFTYQVDVTFVPGNIMLNVDGSGYDLKLFNHMSTSPGSNWLNTFNWDYIQETGFPMVDHSGIGRFLDISDSARERQGRCIKVPIYSLDKTFHLRYDAYTGSTYISVYSSSFTPTNTWMSNSGTYYAENETALNIVIDDYVMDSFRRDYSMTIDDLWAQDTNVYGFTKNGTAYQFGHYDAENDTWTPDYLHKPNEIWTLKFRQSWCTDLLTPTP